MLSSEGPEPARAEKPPESRQAGHLRPPGAAMLAGPRVLTVTHQDLASALTKMFLWAFWGPALGQRFTSMFLVGARDHSKAAAQSCQAGDGLSITPVVRLETIHSLQSLRDRC